MRKSILALLLVPPALAVAALLADPFGTSAATQGAGATPPARQPQQQQQAGTSKTGGQDRPDRGGGGRRRGGPPWMHTREPSGEEWQRAADFMRQNSPARWKWYEQIQDENRKNGMKRFFWWVYQPIDELRNRRDELYDIKVRRVQLDDRVFAAALDVKAPDLTDDQRAERQVTLRQLVGDVVKQDIKERTARIERLQRDLGREEKALHDLEQPDGFERRVGREVDNILNLADGITRHRRDSRGGSEGDPAGGNGDRAPADRAAAPR